eukprot:9076445-Pyramimonas_sp.AAC.1
MATSCPARCIFSRWTNETQEAWVYSHDEPMRRRKRGYILTMDQSDALSSPAARRGVPTAAPTRPPGYP